MTLPTSTLEANYRVAAPLRARLPRASARSGGAHRCPLLPVNGEAGDAKTARVRRPLREILFPAPAYDAVLLYVDRWLIVLTWQGSSAEEFAYWLPMANYAFATFTIPEALWFATDRDLFGISHPAGPND